MSSRHLRAYFEASRRLIMETKEMPVAIAMTFVGVAIWEAQGDDDGDPMTLEELATKVGIPATTMSTHLRYLGNHYRRNKTGLGLVETDEFRHNRRKKIFYLTPKGRGLIRQLDMILRKAG